MPEEKSLLSVEFDKVGDSLDRIVRALRRENDSSDSFSKFYFNDGTTTEENIIGIMDTRYRQNSYLSAVELGTNVTSIADEAFYRCSKLKNVSIPNTVLNIGTSAFAKTNINCVLIFNKTMAEVQIMNNFRFDIESNNIICIDGRL